MSETEAQIAQLYAALDKASAEIGRLESQLDAERAENRQIRELMNTYNLGGWTDSERLIKERDAERAARAQQAEQIIALRRFAEHSVRCEQELVEGGECNCGLSRLLADPSKP